MPRNREKARECSRRYAQNHKEKRNAYSKQYYKEHKQEFLERQAKSRQRMKQEVFAHYTEEQPRCAYCGEDDLVVLCLDHINNDGGIHRKATGIRGGYDLYRRLKRADYPKGYQILCFNCNMRKAFKENNGQN